MNFGPFPERSVLRVPYKPCTVATLAHVILGTGRPGRWPCPRGGHESGESPLAWVGQAALAAWHNGLARYCFQVRVASYFQLPYELGVRLRKRLPLREAIY